MLLFSAIKCWNIKQNLIFYILTREKLTLEMYHLFCIISIIMQDILQETKMLPFFIANFHVLCLWNWAKIVCVKFLILNIKLEDHQSNQLQHYLMKGKYHWWFQGSYKQQFLFKCLLIYSEAFLHSYTCFRRIRNGSCLCLMAGNTVMNNVQVI